MKMIVTMVILYINLRAVRVTVIDDDQISEIETYEKNGTLTDDRKR